MPTHNRTPPTTATTSDATRVAKPQAVDRHNVGFDLPDDSVCPKNPDGTIKDPIAPGTYQGILRHAKCDQQRFVTMGYLCQTLGIKECSYCHAVDPVDPKKVQYAVPTEKKRIANWMLTTFIEGLQRHDGKPMQCDNCHAGSNGPSTMKILAQPRDTDLAQHWMNEVMTAQFVERSGKRLRCKTCHVGLAPGQDGWNPSVLLKLEAQHDGGILRLAEH